MSYSIGQLPVKHLAYALKIFADEQIVVETDSEEDEKTPAKPAATTEMDIDVPSTVQPEVEDEVDKAPVSLDADEVVTDIDEDHEDAQLFHRAEQEPTTQVSTEPLLLQENKPLFDDEDEEEEVEEAAFSNEATCTPESILITWDVTMNFRFFNSGELEKTC